MIVIKQQAADWHHVQLGVDLLVWQARLAQLVLLASPVTTWVHQIVQQLVRLVPLGHVQKAIIVWLAIRVRQQQRMQQRVTHQLV